MWLRKKLRQSPDWWWPRWQYRSELCERGRELKTAVYYLTDPPYP